MSRFMLIRSQAGRDWKRKDRVSEGSVQNRCQRGQILLAVIFQLHKSIFVLLVSLLLASCGCR